MNYLNEEKKLWRRGFKRVICLDEAGRGPLAGPVTAAAVTLLKIPNCRVSAKWVQTLKIKDSKKLTVKRREKFYKVLTHHAAIKWGVARVSEKVIDKINILEATKLAMIKALQNLSKKLNKKLTKKSKKRSVKKSHDREIFCHGVFLILDGNFTLPTKALARAGVSKSISQKSIIKADEKVFSCIAASIIAKVTRDRIMQKYHKKFPKYGFDKHKGYPTKYHIRMLKKYGRCGIHRNSFHYGCSKTKTHKIKTE